MHIYIYTLRTAHTTCKQELLLHLHLLLNLVVSAVRNVACPHVCMRTPRYHENPLPPPPPSLPPSIHPSLRTPTAVTNPTSEHRRSESAPKRGAGPPSKACMSRARPAMRACRVLQVRRPSRRQLPLQRKPARRSTVGERRRVGLWRHGHTRWSGTERGPAGACEA